MIAAYKKQRAAALDNVVSLAAELADAIAQRDQLANELAALKAVAEPKPELSIVPTERDADAA
jgi:hypothetical protein